MVGGLSAGTSVRGWIREGADGNEFVPCGCGQGVQRPDERALESVRSEAGIEGDDVERVFVCEREACGRRTVQWQTAVTEGEK